MSFIFPSDRPGVGNPASNQPSPERRGHVDSLFDDTTSASQEAQAIWDDLEDDDSDNFIFDDEYASLHLPPINPDYNDAASLPSFEALDAQFFDALPRPPSHDSFRQDSSATSSANEQPPPSNQQARRAHRHTPSQYRVNNESPDPFDDYLELTPSPASMPPRNVATRASSVVDLTESSPVQNRNDMAPASKKRKRDTPVEGRAAKIVRPGSSASSNEEDLGKVDLVDLSTVDNDEQYNDFKAKEEALKAKEQADLIKAQNQAEANKPVKLAEFQCIICMDNPTDLTVTHCGHLFCSECLHSALHAGDKKCCPVCRTAISTKVVAGKQPRNGIFALEMKLMTARKKGKQPVKVS